MNAPLLSHPTPRLARAVPEMPRESVPAERRASIVTLNDGRAALVLPGGECGGIAARPEILSAAKRAVEDVSR